jgi:hypothetical protein
MSVQALASIHALADARIIGQGWPAPTLVTVRLHFAGSLHGLDDCLRLEGFTLYDVLAIVDLGDGEFDVAVSEALRICSHPDD